MRLTTASQGRQYLCFMPDMKSAGTMGRPTIQRHAPKEWCIAQSTSTSAATASSMPTHSSTCAMGRAVSHAAAN